MDGFTTNIKNPYDYLLNKAKTPPEGVFVSKYKTDDLYINRSAICGANRPTNKRFSSRLVEFVDLEEA